MSRSSTEIQVYKHAVIVVPNIGSTTGKRKLTGEDLLGTLVADLPPEIVNIGSKRVIDPEYLKVFNACRIQVRRILLKKGFRRLGGFMMQEQDAETALKEIAEIEKTFNARKVALILSLQSITESWANQFPEWKDKILKSALTGEDLDRRLSFDVQVFRLNLDTPKDSKVGIALQKTINDQLGNAEHQVLNEISVDIKESFKAKSQDRTTARVRSLLGRVKDKLESLSWVNPRLGHMGKWVNDLLTELPKTGAIDGAAYLKMASVLKLFQEPDKAIEMADELITFKDMAIALPIEPVESIEDDGRSSDDDDEDSMNSHTLPPPRQSSQYEASEINFGW